MKLETADKVDDDLYKAWRKYTSYGLPSKTGQVQFDVMFYAFQAGWKSALKKVSEK